MKKTKVGVLLLTGCLTLMSANHSAAAGGECMLGEVRAFAGTYAPLNWAFADGSLLNIMDNINIYVVIGTNYGGDGVNTFALPNLIGRTIAGGYYPGVQGGHEFVSISSDDGQINLQNCQTTDQALCTQLINPLDNRSPYVTMNYIICVNGYFPSRN